MADDDSTAGRARARLSRLAARAREARDARRGTRGQRWTGRKPALDADPPAAKPSDDGGRA